MREFKMCADLVFADTFREFAERERLGAEDFILTNETLYNRFIRPLDLPCGVAFLKTYAAGEPTDEAVDRIRSELPRGLKRMAAVGGGSVMDTAKMLSLHTSRNTTAALFDLTPGAEAPTRIFDVYAVPATCGTGSEVTNACAVELVGLHTKRGLNNDLMFPKKSVLIPELLSDLPYRFFAASSIDALIHAAESYLSPRASPISELFSETAVRMILDGYRYLLTNGKARWVDRAGEFQLAACYAGLAFCSAGCAAVHALSYPLGGGYHIPHGEANQLVFAATFRKYKEKKPAGKLERLEAILGDVLHVPPSEALEAAFALFDRVQPRKPLRAFGISADVLPALAEGVVSGQQRLLANNYAPLSAEDMIGIYRSVY